VGENAADILRLRWEFLTRAIDRVQGLIRSGDFDEVNGAVEQLATYFKWIKDEFDPGLQSDLSKRIQSLEQAAKSVSRQCVGAGLGRSSTARKDFWQH
jgi:hypothetical protein